MNANTCARNCHIFYNEFFLWKNQMACVNKITSNVIYLWWLTPLCRIHAVYWCNTYWCEHIQNSPHESITNRDRQTNERTNIRTKHKIERTTWVCMSDSTNKWVNSFEMNNGIDAFKMWNFFEIQLHHNA